MHNNTLEFDLSDAKENLAFAILCASLNQAGTPYEAANSGTLATLTISTGY